MPLPHIKENYLSGFTLQVFSWCLAIFIFGSNSVALATLRTLKPTFLNLLIAMDCSIGVCMGPLHLMVATNLFPFEFCTFKSVAGFCLSLMNGLIPVGIVIYRLALVCFATRMMAAYQRKRLNYFILAITLGVSIPMTLSTLYNKNHINEYLRCIGKSDVGPGWFNNLPMTHPHRLTSVITFVSRTVFVPIGYIIIFLFRNKNAREAPGISDNSRKLRRIRNAVNAKYNFYIWLSEMPIFLMFVYRNPITVRIFLGISFGLSPILYLAGMEETRSELRNFGRKFF